ncbi:MAG: YitT family protein [Ignavibacteriaceae bacterium]|nr:YitT family protein [Ignavibacteriaceae bacterium]
MDFIFKTKKSKIVRDYIGITIGASIMALGISVFLMDAYVVPGGVSGLSMTLSYLTYGKLPIGVTMWVLNLPLFIWGIKELGKSFGARTFYGFTLNSFFVDLFRGDIPYLHFIKLNQSQTIVDLRDNDFFFLILVGATLLGIGLGLVFKFKGTTAGSDIIASILHKRFGIKPGQAIMMIDFFIIASAGIVIYVKDLSPGRPAFSLTLYAMFLLFVSSKIVDIVLDGFDYARVAYIISSKTDEISEAILNDLSRGATALKARGLYKNEDREVLMTVVPLKELVILQDMIKQIDKDAFIIISNVHEVLGEGFRRRI